MLSGIAALLWLALRGVDQLPKGVLQPLGSALGLSLATLEARGLRPGHVIAYRCNLWFWSHSSSKLLLLLALTISLIGGGGLALYASGYPPSLYESLWAAVAGVGLNWSFDNNNNTQDQGMTSRVVALVIALGTVMRASWAACGARAYHCNTRPDAAPTHISCCFLPMHAGGVCVTALLLGIVAGELAQAVGAGCTHCAPACAVSVDAAAPCGSHATAWHLPHCRVPERPGGRAEERAQRGAGV